MESVSNNQRRFVFDRPGDVKNYSGLLQAENATFPYGFFLGINSAEPRADITIGTGLDAPSGGYFFLMGTGSDLYTIRGKADY